MAARTSGRGAPTRLCRPAAALAFLFPAAKPDKLVVAYASGGLFRSDNRGGSWTRTLFVDGRTGDIDVVQDPARPSVLYAATWERDRKAWDFLESGNGSGLRKSTDGGTTWKGIDRQGVHVDYHALSFGPGNSKHVAMGNDGGLYLSFDAGLTLTKMNNLPVGQFTTIAVDDAEPCNVVGGLQDNGTMRGPSNCVAGAMDPGAWRAIGGGDGSMVQIDPKDRNVVYTAFQFGFAQRQNLKTGERVRIRPRPELKEGPLRYNWVTPFLLSPHSREILWYGTNRLYRSFDRGDTFTAVSPDLTSNREQGDVPWGTATSIAESPKKFGVLWVWTDEGKVWLTKDGGASWKDVSKGLAKDRWVTRVVASAFDEGTVYVTQSGYRNDDWSAYVFRSTDYGETWVSLDRGESWTPLTGGLPHVAVHDLAVQPREGGRRPRDARAERLRRRGGASPDADGRGADEGAHGLPGEERHDDARGEEAEDRGPPRGRRLTGTGIS